MTRRDHRRRSAAIGKKVLTALAILAVVVPAVIFIVASRITARWTAVAAGLRNAGEPVTLADLAAMLPPISDDENLALKFAAMQAELSTLAAEARGDAIMVLSRNIDIFEGLPSDTIEPTRAFLADHEQIIERLRTLSYDARGGIEHDWSLPAANVANLANYAHFRTATRLALAREYLNLLDGRRDDLAADVRICWKSSAAVGDDPTAMGAMIRMACDTQARTLIEATLRTGEAPVEVMEEWDVRLQRHAAEDRLLWPLRGERTNALAFPAPTAAIRDLNRTRVVELFDPLIEHRNDPVALLDAVRATDARVRGLSRLYTFAAMSLAPMEHFSSLHVRNVVETWCTRIALAAERYRLDHGRLPESLDLLTPDYIDAVPIDPFDGRPVKLAVTRNGITIYTAFTRGPGRNPSGDDPTEPDSNASFRLYRPDLREVLTFDPIADDE